jgi:hypothetical protein
MNRKAVLVESSDVKNHNDLPGARVDVENWRNFLKSNLGGSWADSEIVTLRKPFSSDVTAAVKLPTDYYCFVAFSGHGREGSVVLNDYNTSFAISDFRPTTDRATVIIDSCRGVERAQRLSFIKTATAFANESRTELVAKNALEEGRATIFASLDNIYNRAENLSLRQNRWEKALRDSAKGTVEMLSCAKGQGAGEDPAAGGYYTSLLLQSAAKWLETNSTAKIHTTKEAHDHAASLLPPQQTPEYRPLGLAFPFAVKA